VPIFHVNGEDCDAVAHVVATAMEYRHKFKSDVVIDMFCFRKWGHNEADEPSFTQPLLYQKIEQHPTVRTLYAKELVERQVIEKAEAEAIVGREHEKLNQAFQSKRSSRPKPAFGAGVWKGYRGGLDTATPEVPTAVSRAVLEEITTCITTLPEGFRPHRVVAKLLANRAAMGKGEAPLDWGMAEHLAFGTLVRDGYMVRLSGQDSRRGTFSHRHAVIVDQRTAQEYVPLEHVSKTQAPCRIYDSPLSEAAVLGFEFGYSLDYPEALVLWEAQFGDFANGAQVIIDQFIVAAEDKWRRLSGLTLLLPHGYEGAGPEHSSARLERFLCMAAEDNIQVCYPTTSAQIFHLLRRQAIRPWRKPLVVMTPKSLLRREEASAPLVEFTQGGFRRLISDHRGPADARVTRLLLCTGKVAYDLLAARAKAKDETVAVARVEQLYPFPEELVRQELARYPSLTEVVWVQEEPQNMGAWSFVFAYLTRLTSSAKQTLPIRFVGREASASPATGFLKTHELEQTLLVEAAMSRGQPNGR